MLDGGDACGPVAPIESSEGHLPESERIGEVDDVLRDRRLFRHPRRRRIAKSRGTVATKIRHEHPIPGIGQGPHDAVPRPHVVRKPMQQDDRKPGTHAVLLVANLEHLGLDAVHGLT